MTSNPPSRARTTRPAFAVVEAVLSALIVGLMLAAAVEMVGKSRASQAWAADRIRAYELASTLMAEITDLAYADPQLPTAILGADDTELITGRAAYDDIDDYHGLSESPPKARDGTAMSTYTDWTRTAQVSWAMPETLGTDSASETGIKRITVSVYKGKRKIAELVAARTFVVNR